MVNNNRVKPVVIGVMLMVFATIISAQAAWAWNRIIRTSESIAANIPPEWMVKQLARTEARESWDTNKNGEGG